MGCYRDSSISTKRMSIETDPGSSLSSRTSLSSRSSHVHWNGALSSNQKSPWFPRHMTPIPEQSAQCGWESSAKVSLRKVKSSMAMYSEPLRSKISQAFDSPTKSEDSGTGHQRSPKRLVENSKVFSRSFRMRHGKEDWSASVQGMQRSSPMDIPHALDVNISTSPMMTPPLDKEIIEDLSTGNSARPREYAPIWSRRQQWPPPSLVAVQPHISPVAIKLSNLDISKSEALDTKGPISPMPGTNLPMDDPYIDSGIQPSDGNIGLFHQPGKYIATGLFLESKTDTSNGSGYLSGDESSGDQPRSDGFVPVETGPATYLGLSEAAKEASTRSATSLTVATQNNGNQVHNHYHQPEVPFGDKLDVKGAIHKRSSVDSYFEKASDSARPSVEEPEYVADVAAKCASPSFLLTPATPSEETHAYSYSEPYFREAEPISRLSPVPRLPPPVETSMSSSRRPSIYRTTSLKQGLSDLGTPLWGASTDDLIAKSDHLASSSFEADTETEGSAQYRPSMGPRETWEKLRDLRNQKYQKIIDGDEDSSEDDSRGLEIRSMCSYERIMHQPTGDMEPARSLPMKAGDTAGEPSPIPPEEQTADKEDVRGLEVIMGIQPDITNYKPGFCPIHQDLRYAVEAIERLSGDYLDVAPSSPDSSSQGLLNATSEVTAAFTTLPVLAKLSESAENIETTREAQDDEEYQSHAPRRSMKVTKSPSHSLFSRTPSATSTLLPDRALLTPNLTRSYRLRPYPDLAESVKKTPSPSVTDGESGLDILHFKDVNRASIDFTGRFRRSSSACADDLDCLHLDESFKLNESTLVGCLRRSSSACVPDSDFSSTEESTELKMAFSEKDLRSSSTGFTDPSEKCCRTLEINKDLIHLQRADLFNCPKHESSGTSVRTVSMTAEEREFLAAFESSMVSVQKSVGRQLRPSKMKKVVKGLLEVEYNIKGHLPTPAQYWCRSKSLSPKKSGFFHVDDQPRAKESPCMSNVVKSSKGKLTVEYGRLDEIHAHRAFNAARLPNFGPPILESENRNIPNVEVAVGSGEVVPVLHGLSLGNSARDISWQMQDSSRAPRVAHDIATVSGVNHLVAANVDINNLSDSKRENNRYDIRHENTIPKSPSPSKAPFSHAGSPSSNGPLSTRLQVPGKIASMKRIPTAHDDAFGVKLERVQSHPGGLKEKEMDKEAGMRVRWAEEVRGGSED